MHNVSPSDPTLPQLTVAFRISPYIKKRKVYFRLFPPASGDELRRRDSKTIRILLESQHSITPDILSVSATFEHPGNPCLHTASSELDPYTFADHNLNDTEYVRTRTVRVVPMDGARPRITISCLPTELLMKIFGAADSREWQRDLLSFAQVCRQWSKCSMKLFCARVESSEWKNHCLSFPAHSLDPRAFGKTLVEAPVLGLGMQYLDLDQHRGSRRACWNHVRQKASPGFTQAVVAILRTTKNLQRLHLSLGYSSQANALFSALPELHDLHTLSITHTTCQFSSFPRTKYWVYSISTIQLSRCMARWPALTSLKVERLAAVNIMGRLFLRPPACALTQLCIRYSCISDKDLLYLTASSANTLVQVTLDRLWGITYDGLYAFLDSISRNVASLTVRDVPNHKLPPRHKKQHALDDVVGRMRCLQALNIRGNVASERMLRRRSGVFLKSGGSGVPVVRLSFEAVPGILGCKGGEWAGWDVV